MGSPIASVVIFCQKWTQHGESVSEGRICRVIDEKRNTLIQKRECRPFFFVAVLKSFVLFRQKIVPRTSIFDLRSSVAILFPRNSQAGRDPNRNREILASAEPIEIGSRS